MGTKLVGKIRDGTIRHVPRSWASNTEQRKGVDGLGYDTSANSETSSDNDRDKEGEGHLSCMAAVCRTTAVDPRVPTQCRDGARRIFADIPTEYYRDGCTSRFCVVGQADVACTKRLLLLLWETIHDVLGATLLPTI